MSEWFSLQPFKCQVSAAARVLFSLKCLIQDISLFGEQNVHSVGHSPVHLLNTNYSSFIYGSFDDTFNSSNYIVSNG